MEKQPCTNLAEFIRTVCKNSSSNGPAVVNTIKELRENVIEAQFESELRTDFDQIDYIEERQ